MGGEMGMDFLCVIETEIVTAQDMVMVEARDG